MQVKPEAIDSRFRRVFEVSWKEAIEETRLLLEETLHLVERQFPQIDTAPIYRRLNYVRAAHEVPIDL